MIACKEKVRPPDARPERSCSFGLVRMRLRPFRNTDQWFRNPPIIDGGRGSATPNADKGMAGPSPACVVSLWGAWSADGLGSEAEAGCSRYVG